MAISKAKKIREEIITKIKKALTAEGWNEDRYGNLKKTNEKGTYRIKFNENALRYEVQVTYEATKYTSQSKSWVRLRSGFYKDIEIVYTEKGIRLKGLK